MIVVQGDKGEKLIYETFKANFDQIFCDHKWIYNPTIDDWQGQWYGIKHIYECPKCLSVKCEEKFTPSSK